MTKVPVRVVAEYQRFGDGPAKDMMTYLLDKGVKSKDINLFEITAIHPGIYGLELIQFTVDLDMDSGLDVEQAKEFCEDILNGIIHDTDVSVRWIYPIAWTGVTSEASIL